MDAGKGAQDDSSTDLNVLKTVVMGIALTFNVDGKYNSLSQWFSDCGSQTVSHDPFFCVCGSGAHDLETTNHSRGMSQLMKCVAH